MAAPPFTIAEVNALDRDGFVARFGGLYEGSPWIAAAAWEARPFADRAALHRALQAVVDRAPRERQVALIRAHPDLAGRAALAGTLGRASTGEQTAAGLDPDRLSPEEKSRFAALNGAYRARFGFPFVVCARENRKETILAGFAARLDTPRDQEIAVALSEIAKICHHRLADLLPEDDRTHRHVGTTVPLPRHGGAARRSTMDGVAYEIGYGKRRVPLYRVHAAPLRGVTPIPESPFTGRANALFACEVDVEVLGDDFLPAYTEGDNANVVATDSMKNVVLREALAYDGATLEGFLAQLGRRFTATYAQLRILRLSARELPFVPVPVPDGAGGFVADDNLFERRGGDTAFATLEIVDDRVTAHQSGRVSMELMKLSGSAFTSFVRDGFTTLPDRRDRPLFVHLDVHWRYADVADLLAPDPARYVPAEQVRDLVRAIFAGFVSESIQHLVHEIGGRLFHRFPQLAEVSFAARNLTRDPAGESVTDPRIKVYSDPFPAYGEITLTMSRGEA